MAYLFIDKDGSEHISNEKPCRHGCMEINGEKYCTSENEDGSVEGSCFIDGKGLVTIACDKSSLSYWVSYESEPTHLPKGSIKKLIGKEMTFEDEPYEL